MHIKPRRWRPTTRNEYSRLNNNTSATRTMNMKIQRRNLLTQTLHLQNQRPEPRTSTNVIQWTSSFLGLKCVVSTPKSSIVPCFCSPWTVSVTVTLHHQNNSRYGANWIRSVFKDIVVRVPPEMWPTEVTKNNVIIATEERFVVLTTPENKPVPKQTVGTVFNELVAHLDILKIR